MSTPARIARGTGITLGTLVINILGQIATVPIFLSYWDAKTYGVWLIMISGFGYLFLLSTAFQQYAYGEMLKVGAAGGDALRTTYRTSVAMAFAVATIELMIVLVLTSKPILVLIVPNLYGTFLFDTVISFLLLYSALNFLIMPVNAITAYANTVHGHYPRVATWALVNAVSRLAAPAIAVLAGADFGTAALVYVLAHVASVLPALADMLRLASREGLLGLGPVLWRQGLRNVSFSLPLAGRTFIDSFRQQGFRILLGTYAGATAVTTLATTRTFANVLHQGLSTITAPLMPELMRYVVNRDQARMEGAFAIVWLCLFALLVPGVLILSLLAEPVFLFWTRGTVGYDPVLFLTLLVAVLVYASGQPANAILQGQNRIAWMISISVVSALGLAVFSVLLIPHFGLRGAGFALLGAELCAAMLSVAGAARALRQSELDFPRRSFVLVAAMEGTVFVLTFLAVTKWSDHALAMTFPFAANVLFAVLYWTTIPALARTRIFALLATIRARLPEWAGGASGLK